MNTNTYPLSKKLGYLLLEQKIKIVAAESCTAGELSAAITRVPGSSAWFDRGFIVYSNTSKIEILNVSPKTLDEWGAVSQEVAQEMALGALQHSQAHIALSTTGIAGPMGGTPEKPVGTVCFGLAIKNGKCESRIARFESGRRHVRVCSVIFALQWLCETLEAATSLRNL